MSQSARIGATLGASLMLALSACSDAQADSYRPGHVASYRDAIVTCAGAAVGAYLGGVKRDAGRTVRREKAG